MASTGQRFGPYRCVRKLGSGGMAETWLAVQRRDAGFEQRVCLKVVHEALRGSDEFATLFLREAAIAAALRHSNIVRVIGASPEQGCMALELIDGTDLRHLLAHAPGHRLSPPVITFLAIELCKALHYAHTLTRNGEFAGIVHRDVSPPNILISYAGEVKLADFGIAKAIHATGDPRSGVRGKLAYMSPEQILNRPLDARGDLFSLGAVLFEAASGQRPFDAPSDAELWQHIRAGQRPALRALAPELPAPLCAVIERALQREPERRFDSAAQIIHALAPLTPLPTVYRELGKLARRAMPHRTVAFEVDATLLDEASARPAARRSQVVTRTLHRAPRTTSPLRAARPPTLPPVDRARALRTLAVGAAAAAALSLAGVWAYRDYAPPAGNLVTPMPAPALQAVEIPPAAVAAAPHPLPIAPDPATLAPAAQLTAQPSSAAPPSASAGVAGPRTPAPRTEERALIATSPERAPRPRPVAPRSESQGGSSAHEPRVEVVVGVFPGGMVWVDGQLRGRAPLTLHLTPGRHVLAAGQGVPVDSREVLIGPGPTEPIVFRLRPTLANSQSQ